MQRRLEKGWLWFSSGPLQGSGLFEIRQEERGRVVIHILLAGLIHLIPVSSKRNHCYKMVAAAAGYEVSTRWLEDLGQSDLHRNKQPERDAEHSCSSA